MPKDRIKKIGIIAKSTIVDHEDCLKKLVKFLKKKGKKVMLDSNSSLRLNKETGHTRDYLFNHCDMVIVLGGDGTLLKAVRFLGQKVTYVVGVNFGTKGFMTEFTPDKMIEGLGKMFQGHYEIDKRSVLRITIYRKGKKEDTFLALNEVAINQGVIARLIKMRIEIDQRKMMDIDADGIIISTPTGSTGHSLSAGGPIVHPAVSGMIITPVCPASLSLRPIVVPMMQRQLSVTIQTKRRDQKGDLGLTVDGQKCVALKYGDEIKVRKSRRSLYLLRLTNKMYYRTLRTKLHWGTE